MCEYVTFSHMQRAQRVTWGMQPCLALRTLQSGSAPCAQRLHGPSEQQLGGLFGHLHYDSASQHPILEIPDSYVHRQTELMHKQTELMHGTDTCHDTRKQ